MGLLLFGGTVNRAVLLWILIWILPGTNDSMIDLDAIWTVFFVTNSAPDGFDNRWTLSGCVYNNLLIFLFFLWENKIRYKEISNYDKKNNFKSPNSNIHFFFHTNTPLYQFFFQSERLLPKGSVMEAHAIP